MHGTFADVEEVPVRYQSPDEDSARWLEFTFRDGDIVISTRSKSGTTWMQMVCALLVFQRPDLPAPLAELSPWLDWLVVPLDEMLADLEAQRHRRFVKTHTPLDGIVLDDRATYIVVARHPLDMAVSLYHQGDNLDRERIRELTGAPAAAAGPRPRPDVSTWLRGWIDDDADPRTDMDSLPGVMWHLSDAWRRRDAHNVVLAHYHDLERDLEGEMRRLAGILGIQVAEAAWAGLVAAARFDSMRAKADVLAPDPVGVLKSKATFFRHGASGDGRAELSDADVAHYHERAAQLAPADLLEWLHRPVAP